MAYKSFGLFVPTECDQTELSVLSGIVVADGHTTPTACNEAESILSPYAERLTNAVVPKFSGFLNPEIMSGYAQDPDNYPGDRPQIDNNIKTAVNSGNMTLSIRGDCCMGYNNDRGNAILQSGNCIDEDHKIKGNFVWNATDPIVGGVDTPNTDYMGKSRLPVMDYLDSALFYEKDGETQITSLYYPSIYSDGDFIYAVAMVFDSVSAGGWACGGIGFFVFDTYKRIFIKLSNINASIEEFILSAGNTAMFNGIVSGITPMSPVVCRVKNFMNKLVCVFAGVKTSNRTTFALYVYQSYDNGITWEEVLKDGWGYDGFYEYMKPYIPLEDFRVRIASDEQDVVLMWGFTTRPASNNGQIRLMCSKDGCMTWEYGQSNISRSFTANTSDLNDTCFNTTTVIPRDVYFGLTVDSDGKFVASKSGEGEFRDITGTLRVGNSRLVFVIIEGTSILSTHVVPVSNMNPSYYDPWANGPSTTSLRYIGDIALFSDHVQREDYMVVKVQQGVADYSGFLNTQFFNCIVRFKIMPRSEWTTNPDWMDTGIATDAAFGDYITFIEPINRNHAWSVSNAIGANSNHFIFYHGVVHRGHIIICGVTHSTTFLVPFIACFKSWTNMPIQYPVRFNYNAIVGDPNTYGGMVPNTSGVAGAAVTLTPVPASNIFRYTSAPGTLWGVGDYSRHSVTYSMPASRDYRGSIVGVHENVIRVVVSKQNVPAAAGNLLIVDHRGAYWSTTLSQWYMKYFRVFATSTGFSINTDGSYLTVVGNSFAALDNTFYEIMAISTGSVGSDIATVWYRLYSDNTNSKIVEKWTFLTRIAYVSPNVFPMGGYTSIRMAMWSSAIFNVGASAMIIEFKNLTTSKSHNDSYPTLCNNKMVYFALVDGSTNWDTYYNWLTTNGRPTGVLTSEFRWGFDNPAGVGNMRTSVRGENISPEPIWVGENWLVSPVTSNFSKRDAVVWLNMDSTYQTILSSTYTLTENKGNLSFKYKSGAAALRWNDFYMGTGLGVNAPTLLTPMGMNFNGTQYLKESADNTNLALTNNFTISFWMRRTALGNTGLIIDKQVLPRATSFALQVNAPASGFWFWVGGLGYAGPSVFSNVGDQNKWVHVTITFKDNTLRWFKNGVDVGITNASAITAAVTTTRMFIGTDSTGASGFVGDLNKIAIFDRVLEGKEIQELFLEGIYGPRIPSDFFVRFFGEYGIFEDTWRLLPRNAGGTPDNVLDSMVGSKYTSNKGDVESIHNPVLYGPGDVEIILYQKDTKANASYITANAVLIMGCNATDVAVYYKDTEPLSTGIIGTLAGSGVFRYSDSEYGIPDFIFRDTSDAFSDEGVITNLASAADWRPNLYVGERINCIYNPGSLDWQSAVDMNSYIFKCIANDERKLVTDCNLVDMSYTAGTTYVYQLADALLVVFPNSITARYWRFIFGNNAKNGEKIKVGMIRLGTLVQFDINPDTPFNITRRIVEKDLKSNVPGINVTTPYLKKIKSDFDIRMEHTDVRSDGSDYQKLLQTYHTALNSRDGVFLALCNDSAGFAAATYKYFPLVFRCAPDGDMTVEHSGMSHKNISIKLKEM